MAQTRVYFRTGKRQAAQAFALLESTFEDDGWPIAVVDIDEDADIHEVSVYVDDPAFAMKRIRETIASVVTEPALAAEDVPDIDWVTKSLEGLKPVRAGRFLVHGSHDRDDRRIGDLGIEIEAGLAFGTGHHGTTSGCLDVLARVTRNERPRNALDLGTGSAVLAIALAKLAHIRVLATDIDPVATKVAAQNARLNGVHAWVETKTATGFHHPSFAHRGPFDLIVANILARPLMKLAPGMARHLARRGSLVLSGILASQRNAVVAAYRVQGFRLVSTLWREGWVTLHLKRGR